MQVWPFLVLTLGLFFGVGYLIATTEKSVVMHNWPQMRCSVPIMFAASFFKPSGDKRSSGEFAMDNFEFCMKSLVHEVMEIVMAPLYAIFGKHVSMAEVMTDTMNGVRKIMHTIYEAFLSFIEPFLKKFEAVTYQVGIVTQHMRMAFQRVNAMMLAMLFSGLSIIKGFMNAIDFVISVVMIIVAIMVALIIILFFVLFPFIPLILTVLTAVVAVAIGSVAATASSSMGAFCFPPTALIALEGGQQKPISEVEVGDVLAGGSVVEATMVFDGKGSALWDIEGVIVAGSHRVRHAALGWPLVQDDPRARPTTVDAPFLYCLTTSSRKIPVMSPVRKAIVWFRDWEEMEEGDMDTDIAWNSLVLTILNGARPMAPPSTVENHLIGRDVRILTVGGARRLGDIRIGDRVLGNEFETTRVIGIVEGPHSEVRGGEKGWSGCLVFDSTTAQWERVPSFPSHDSQYGRHLITDAGTFLILAPDTGKITAVRDHTEVGMARIHLTYPFVEERIRSCPL